MPLRDESGNVIGTWGITADVTAQVEAERALTRSREQSDASERMHRAMFEHNPQPMWLYDRRSFQVVAVNDAALAAYGYSRDEFLAMTIPDLLAAEGAAEFVRSMTLGDGEQTGFVVSIPSRHRYRDGTVVDVEVTANDVNLDGRACRIVLSQNVTERNRAAAELASARDEAIEASNAKSAFLANISHEIRTPMNGVLGMADLLLDSGLNEDQRQLAEQVAASGEAMLALLNDILDISKIDAGKLQLEVSDFSLRESIDRACAIVRPQASAKGIELAQEIDQAVPQQLSGDGRRLHQILLNLIVNAVKFTSDGKVVVRAGVAAGRDRYRDRDRAEAPRRNVRAVHASRRLHDAQIWRHRPRSSNLTRADRADGGSDRRDQRTRRRQHVLDRDSTARTDLAKRQIVGSDQSRGRHEAAVVSRSARARGRGQSRQPDRGSPHA